LQEAFDINNESAFKAASGLHGGIGGRGDVCGSILGASLFIGLMCGDNVAESGKPKENFNPAAGPPPENIPTGLVGRLYDWFGEEFGSVKCNDIRGKHEKEVDAAPDAKRLTDMERMQRIYSKCDELCGKTATRTVELIWDYLGK